MLVWEQIKNNSGLSKIEVAFSQKFMWVVQGWWCPSRSQGLMLPLYSAIFKTSHLIILYVFQSVERRKRRKSHTFTVRTGPRNCTYVSTLIALPQDTLAKKARNCMYSIWPCVQVKSRGSIKGKGKKWILGYYQQYMLFKLIQKLYVQSQEKKRKIWLMFLIRNMTKLQ